jgi:hypothetical protein
MLALMSYFGTGVIKRRYLGVKIPPANLQPELRQGGSDVCRRIGGPYGLRQSKRKQHGLVLIAPNLGSRWAVSWCQPLACRERLSEAVAQIVGLAKIPQDHSAIGDGSLVTSSQSFPPSRRLSSRSTKNNRTRYWSPRTSPRLLNAQYGTRIRNMTKQVARPT